MTRSGSDRQEVMSQLLEIVLSQVRRPRTPSRPALERAGRAREERRKRQGVCDQRLKSDKVCSAHKSQRGAGACVLGVLGGGEEGGSRDSLGVLQAGKTSPRVCQCLHERPVGRSPSGGTRLYGSRAPRWSCPRRSPGLARVSLSPSTPPPSTSARLFPPSLRAPARHWLGHGSLRGEGGGRGCSFPPLRRTLFRGAEASSPARRLKPSISPFAC